jgi:hypothetical protein
MNRRARLAILCLVASVSMGVPAIAQKQGAPQTYHARLSTVPIDLAMAQTIAGRGSVTATLKGRTLVLTGTFSGLKTPATVARLHRSPNRGIRGAAIADLTATAAVTGEITGSVELTAAQVEDLEKGRLYVQLHSEKAPDGNLWGWLLTK